MVCEVGVVVEGMMIGEGTVLEVNSRIRKGAVVGKVCLLD